MENFAPESAHFPSETAGESLSVIFLHASGYKTGEMAGKLGDELSFFLPAASIVAGWRLGEVGNKRRRR